MGNTLKNRVAIVAGSWAEVVGSTVRKLLSEGATVVVPAKSAAEIQALQQKVGLTNTGHLVTLLLNYPDYEKAAELQETIIEQFGAIDLAVVCFESLPVHALRDLTKIDYPDWEKMVDQNITAFFIAARVLLNGMMKYRHGSFISVRHLDGLPETEPSSFSDLSDSWVTEMARLFFAEAEQSDVKCFHVSVRHSGNYPAGGEPGGVAPQKRVNDIGKFIMKIFNGHETRHDARFQAVILDDHDD